MKKLMINFLHKCEAGNPKNIHSEVISGEVRNSEQILSIFTRCGDVPFLKNKISLFHESTKMYTT